jgi:hypothetical protein
MRLTFVNVCLAVSTAFLSGASLTAANYALGGVCGAISLAALFYVYAVMFYPSQRLS